MTHLGLVTVLVDDYDRAIDFYVGALGFHLTHDTRLDDAKRWVVVTPPGARETALLLARAATPTQRDRIGDQTGGRVALFLYTDRFDAEHARLRHAGVHFAEPPRDEPYGRVAVFRDLYGNRWDLIAPHHPPAPALNLATAHIRLRDLRPDDEADVHAFAGDPDVTRHTDWGPNTPADTAAFLHDAVTAAGAHPRTRYPLGITRSDDDRVIGAVELHLTSTHHRRAELGYALARHAWGHGHATAAARLLLRHAFDTLGLHRVTATCHPDNTASARVLTRIGMQPEGRLREHLLVRGGWQDRLMFAAVAPPDPG